MSAINSGRRAVLAIAAALNRPAYRMVALGGEAALRAHWNCRPWRE